MLASYNERPVKDGTTIVGYSYLPPIPGASEASPASGISALDDSTDTYIDFVDTQNSKRVLKWLPAKANAAVVDYFDATKSTTYDSAFLAKCYSDAAGAYYPLRTVAQLGESSVNTAATLTAPADFVATHYGDWPAPEIFVMNEAS